MLLNAMISCVIHTANKIKSDLVVTWSSNQLKAVIEVL